VEFGQRCYSTIQEKLQNNFEGLLVDKGLDKSSLGPPEYRGANLLMPTTQKRSIGEKEA